MILVDTSVWIAHLRSPDERLSGLLAKRLIFTHPFVVGELSLGDTTQRRRTAEAIKDLRAIAPARDDEVVAFINRFSLWNQGIGYLDAHLIVATVLHPGTLLWSYDKRLRGVAERLRVAGPRFH